MKSELPSGGNYDEKEDIEGGKAGLWGGSGSGSGSGKKTGGKENWIAELSAVREARELDASELDASELEAVGSGEQRIERVRDGHVELIE